MKDVFALAGLILAVAMMVLTVLWNVAIWNECRTDHSFFYCARVLGK